MDTAERISQHSTADNSGPINQIAWIQNGDYDMAALVKSYLMARAAACANMPYLQPLIVAMSYRISEDVVRPVQQDDTVYMVPTMCVTADAKCAMHPHFIQEVLADGGGTQALAFIVAHEAMHILFRHSERKRRMFEREGQNWDSGLDGLAADLSINPSLKLVSEKRRPGVMGITPPIGEHAGVFPEYFGLKDGLTYEQYYELLKKNKKPQPKNAGAPGAGCGAGTPEGNGAKNEKTQNVLNNMPGLSEARLEQLQNEVQEKAKQAEQRNRGSVPAGLLLELEESFKEPKIRWQDVLKALVFWGVEHIRGDNSSNFVDPNRRQAGLGYGVGAPRLPGHHDYRPRIVVIGDTSGSMGGNLDDLVSETMGIVNECGGECEFIACDTQAYDGGKVSSVADVARNIRGGGGTDMTAALDMAKEKNADVVVCITDGYIGPYGEDRGYNLIWCLVPGGSDTDINKSVSEGWAQLVRIEKDE